MGEPVSGSPAEQGLDETRTETPDWGHWCYEQQPVRLPLSQPRCPQCGALNWAPARGQDDG